MNERRRDIAEMQRNLRPSACPGLFRIVAARDGGLCRLRIPLGHLSAAQAGAIADAAERLGSGIVDITNRANLQIRGIAPSAEHALIDRLLDAGLGPSQSDTDDIRNIMVSPAAGIDPAQEIDVLPLARDLLTLLETDPACRGLSPKFSLLIDGGESIADAEHPQDVWLASTGPDGFALGVGGSPPCTPADGTPFLLVAADRAVTAAGAVLSLFRERAGAEGEITRMRHLLRQIPRATFLADLAGRLDGAALTTAATSGWHRRPVDPYPPVGRRRQRQEGLEMIGAVPPLGRLSPRSLRALAEIAGRFGGGLLRLTPHRSVLLPSVPSAQGASAAKALAEAGLVCDPASPLAGLVACAGMAGCHAARAETKADALALGALLQGNGRQRIHLSGCEKSCAMPHAADVTLVATAPGRYDLFRRTTGDGHRFGERQGCALTLPEIATRLARRNETEG